MGPDFGVRELASAEFLDYNIFEGKKGSGARDQ
jgi:hypothetical protein